MSELHIEVVDNDGGFGWQVYRDVDQGDGEVERQFIATSARAYHGTRDSALQDFFTLFFGSYDESFLALYNEWDPQHNKVGT